VLVVAAVTDAMAEIMEKCTRFQLDTSLNGKMVDGLKLIEQYEAEFADVFGVALIVVQAPAKTARGEQDLASLGAVAVRFLAGKGFVGNLFEEPFPDANAGNGEGADVKIASEGDEDERCDGHDVGAIATDAEGFHARTDIALENVRKALAEQRDFQGGEAILAGTGSDVG